MEPFALNIIMILCFVLGSGLIILEAFIPGFGVAGVFGVLLEIAAIWATWQLHGLAAALIALLAVLLLIGLAIFLSYRSAMHGKIGKSPLVLKDTESGSAPAPSQWTGKEGIAVSALRPAGMIEVEGTRLNAESPGVFIEKGAAVSITGVEGNRLIVRRKA